MEVYLVRHGETNGNVAHRHQVEKTPLTFRGEEQAKTAAAEIKELQPTHLLSSKLVRAIETARVIGAACNLVPDTTDNVVELARPKALYGKHHTSLPSLLFYVQWYFGVGRAAKEGEPYVALRDRIERAKDELSHYPADARVVVVSHAVFITFFVAQLCTTKRLSLLTAAHTFRKLLTMKNASMVKVSYNPDCTTGCAWTVEREA